MPSSGGCQRRCSQRSVYADRSARDRALADWLAERGARLVVLAGYMELLGAAFLDRFPSAVINVHPSLLPAFPGMHAVEQALAYGVKVFGVTVHFVDAGVDSGAVILQGAVELRGCARAGRGAGGAAPARARAACRARSRCSRVARSASTPANPRRIAIRADDAAGGSEGLGAAT